MPTGDSSTVPPVPPSEPPPELAILAPEWTPTLAYAAFPRLSTWRLTHPDGRVRFAKIDLEDSYPTLEGEAERMRWAAAFLPVPSVVTVDRFDDCTVLITEGMPGRDGMDPEWRGDLPALVSAFGKGLAAFHRSVDETLCPFRFALDAAMEHIHHRVDTGLIRPTREFEHEFAHLTLDAALTMLHECAPATEDLVVCHGDYCPPNTLLCDGRVTGYVDLGELGVADRWRDIAIGSWSTGWSFGPEFEALFYESYGIAPDPERIRFYRLLWALGS